MKIVLSLSLLALCAAPAFAIFGVGDVVYDPVNDANLITMDANSMAQWAEAIKRYETQIQNQLDQIQKAKDMIEGQNILKARIGDWNSVIEKAKSLELSAKKLTTPLHPNYKNLIKVDTGDSSPAYTDGGNFATLNVSLLDGTTAKIDEKGLRRYKAVENLYDGVNKTFEDTETRRTALLQEIATTSEAIANAPTQAEADKLKAKLDGLKTALVDVQAQRDEAIQRMQAQHTINQNQQEKERQVKSEVEDQNAAQLSKTMGSLQTGGQSFR